MGTITMKRLAYLFIALAATCLTTQSLDAQEKKEESKLPKIEDPKGLKRLVPDADVWFDVKNRQVVVSGHVCQRDALLEMFACPAGTKEHESIVGVKAKALFVHTALLAAGAKSGHPARWDRETKEYNPAKGTRVDIHVEWLDADGKRQRAKAQDWVRNAKTKKAMAHHWVFGGSGFHFDETTKTKHYLADSGSLICVSNFPDAMLDLPIESSQSNEELLYTPFTERIPAQGTRVLLYLKPVLDEKKSAKKANGEAAN